jgi:primary-amine oxidase
MSTNRGSTGPSFYSVVNKDKPNKFGEYPGYRISPATGNAIHLTVQNSSNVMNSVNYVTHHFYATKQKDTEAQVSHQFNSVDRVNPLIDFAKFFDGESLDQEDMYVWNLSP